MPKETQLFVGKTPMQESLNTLHAEIIANALLEYLKGKLDNLQIQITANYIVSGDAHIYQNSTVNNNY